MGSGQKPPTPPADLTFLIGQTEQEAIKALLPCHLRVTTRDGAGAMMSAGYRSDRVNVRIVGGKVSEVVGIG